MCMKGNGDPSHAVVCMDAGAKVGELTVPKAIRKLNEGYQRSTYEGDAVVARSQTTTCFATG